MELLNDIVNTFILLFLFGVMIWLTIENKKMKEDK